MFSPFGEWQLKIENLGEEKDNWGFLEYFAIKFMGNGYDQLDIKCPDQLIYDLSSGICLEQCPKGSFKKLVSPVRELAPVKRDEVRTIFIINQSHESILGFPIWLSMPSLPKKLLSLYRFSKLPSKTRPNKSEWSWSTSNRLDSRIGFWVGHLSIF